MTGFFSVNRKKLLTYVFISLVLTAAAIIGAGVFLKLSFKNTYTKDNVIAGMQLLHDPLPATVHTEVPWPLPVPDPQQSRLDTIRKRGIIRVGYHGDALPFAFFNGAGHLVGLDIDMAHSLARALGVELEFVPFEYQTLSRQLQESHFDIAMSGVPLVPEYLEEVSFSHTYLDLTWAFAVRDYRTREFAKLESIKQMDDLTIGVATTRSFFVSGLQELFPSAKIVILKSFREFFEKQKVEVDAILISAEAGSAWTLLYPRYQVVVLKPTSYSAPLAYPVAGGDQELLNYVNSWIDINKKDGTIQELYDYWILGQGAVERQPRWSIIRDVLHWVD
jgi:ABC-type amino acid transport substrate-binding protein